MSDDIIKRKEKEDSAIEIHIDEHKRIGSSLIESLRRNPEVGSQMLHVANQRVEKWFTEEVLKQIEDLIKHKNQLLLNMEKAGAEVQMTEKRIAAINAGEFKIGWSGRIEYNDRVLNLG